MSAMIIQGALKIGGAIFEGLEAQRAAKRQNKAHIEEIQRLYRVKSVARLQYRINTDIVEGKHARRSAMQLASKGLLLDKLISDGAKRRGTNKARLGGQGGRNKSRVKADDNVQTSRSTGQARAANDDELSELYSQASGQQHELTTKLNNTMRRADDEIESNRRSAKAAIKSGKNAWFKALFGMASGAANMMPAKGG